MLLSKNFIAPSLFLFSLLFSTTGFATKGRDAQLFQMCTACHGPHGEGKENLTTPAIAGMPEWYLVRQLNNFKSGARGLNPHDLGGLRMRPMAKTLQTEADIKLVAAYISKLPVNEVKQVVEGNVIAGQSGYAVCSACHGADGKGNETLNAPSLLIANDWYLLTQLKNFKNKVRGADSAKDPNGATMGGIVGALDEKAMEDIVYYIQTLKEKGKK